jgi:serine/threonine protein kinase
MSSEQAQQPSEWTPREGLVVAGRYRLLSRIGSGAMGAVWCAEHTTLGHTVAMKLLHATETRDRDSRSRFDREAKIAARLSDSSKHIARVVDHGVLPDGTPYLVMELLKGEGLDARIRREKQLPPLWVLEIVRQLCRALQVAHEAGVVHRDLKPANVFLCEEEDGNLLVKLLDFGVAKAQLEGASYQTTAAGSLIGTPGYMSPEQFDGATPVDSRADLWAATVMIYRMLAGTEPFTASGLSELALRIVMSNPTPPTQIDPRLPKALDAFVERGLAKKPADRFQTAPELGNALDAVFGAQPAVYLDTRGPESVVASQLLQGTLSDAATTQTVKSPERNLTWPVVTGLSLALAIGGIAFAATRGSTKAPANEAASASPGREEPSPPPAAAKQTVAKIVQVDSASVTAAPSESAPAAPPKPLGPKVKTEPTPSAKTSSPQDLEKKAGAQWNDGTQM